MVASLFAVFLRFSKTLSRTIFDLFSTTYESGSLCFILTSRESQVALLSLIFGFGSKHGLASKALALVS